jgi:hypothetical protein
MLVGVASALPASTGIAQAEWAAASSPCDEAPGAINPPPQLGFEVETPERPPLGYFTYEAEPGAVIPGATCPIR